MVFLVSEPAPFRASLEDVDSGFDWRVADRSRGLWVEGAVDVEVDGLPLEPLSVEEWVGRVSFGRSVRGSKVVADGWCLPVALAASVASWGLTTSLEGVGGDLGWDDCAPDGLEGRLFCVLPFGAGAIRGFGSISVEGGPPRIVLKGELRYGSRV